MDYANCEARSELTEYPQTPKMEAEDAYYQTWHVESGLCLDG